MIYTVTLNPSLDYIVTVKDFAMGKTNRTETEGMLPGGKGINVSTVLHHLGIESTALGFTAGFTGAEIEKRAAEIGFRCEFIRVEDGFSRINIKMKDFDGMEINGQGPVIGEEETERLLKRLDELHAGDVLVLAGSVPKGMSKYIYRDILERMSGKGVLCVVDAAGDLLLNVLRYHPFLIKPNNHELGEVFGVELKSRESVIPYAKKLLEMGARNVLVSLAGEGAVLAAENGKVYMLEAPKGILVNAVGAGDSMVAGFLAGWLQDDLQATVGSELREANAGKQEYAAMEEARYLHAFRMGVASGSASAFSEGLAAKEEILQIYNSHIYCGKNVNCGL